MRYRKKPVIIEAVQWTGLNLTEIKEFVGESASIGSPDSSEVEDGHRHAEITIHTLEGNMHVSINDYVIKGVEGEFYPCKPDIFEKTYEEVKD